MKILTYNIEWGSGVGKGYYQYLTKGWRYFFPDKKVVEHLGQLIKELDPDVIFLVEVTDAILPLTSFNEAIYFFLNDQINN